MGNHSVGKWDPIPRCGERGKPQLGEMVACQIVSFFFYYYYFMIERETQHNVPLQ